MRAYFGTALSPRCFAKVYRLKAFENYWDPAPRIPHCTVVKARDDSETPI